MSLCYIFVPKLSIGSGKMAKMEENRDSITKCKIFVLNSHHIFDARDLMADWGWGFTNPQPLPNPMLSRAKGNFQLAIQKKETEVSLRLTNFVLHMYKQLTFIFALSIGS